MAKNYTFAEAVAIINAGTDLEAISDIGRRYPVLLHKVTKVTTKAGEDFVELMSFMPDHLTANKVNTSIKNNVGSDVTEDAETDEAETPIVDEPADDVPAKPTKVAKTAKAEPETKTEGDGPDYESMSGKELWDILGKAGKRKDCKEKMGGTEKDLIVEYIRKYGLGDTVKQEAIEVPEVDDSEATENANPYEGKSAMELFKECKKRGIKTETKKPAKYYIDLLIKADAEATNDTESDDDDWGDEAVEEPKATKPAKKAAKKAEPVADDDDWDI
jgi:hypothetical protein